MKFTYLIIDLSSLLIPLLFTFHPKLQFQKRLRKFLPVLFAVAFLFCLWDFFFVRLGVWGFNDRYITGIKLATLPLEEILFFLCIPYACVFSYHCFGIMMKKFYFVNTIKWIGYLLTVALLVIAFIFYNRLYTLVSFIFLAVAISLTAGKKFFPQFFITWLIMLVPFLIVNGILTGTGLEEPVVMYHPDEIIGARVMTIPVEDFFYGMLLILANVAGLEISEAGKRS